MLKTHAFLSVFFSLQCSYSYAAEWPLFLPQNDAQRAAEPVPEAYGQIVEIQKPKPKPIQIMKKWNTETFNAFPDLPFPEEEQKWDGPVKDSRGLYTLGFILYIYSTVELSEDGYDFYAAVFKAMFDPKFPKVPGGAHITNANQGFACLYNSLNSSREEYYGHPKKRLLFEQNELWQRIHSHDFLFEKHGFKDVLNRFPKKIRDFDFLDALAELD